MSYEGSLFENGNDQDNVFLLSNCHSITGVSEAVWSIQKTKVHFEQISYFRYSAKCTENPESWESPVWRDNHVITQTIILIIAFSNEDDLSDLCLN